MKIFIQTEKMIQILSISFVLAGNTKGKGDRRAEGIIFLVHLFKFESYTATSKNIAIIRL